MRDCRRPAFWLIGILLLAGCSAPQLRQADQLARDRQWDQAVAAYREAAKKDPFNDKIQVALANAKQEAAAEHCLKGHGALTESRLSEALGEFKMAVSLDPSRSEYHLAVRDVLRLQDARVFLQEGNRFRNLGRLDEAAAAYERALALEPSLSPALEGIADIERHQRREQNRGSKEQPITLRFQNAKVKEVLEVLARTSDLNVVFDKEVRDDPVTVFIKEMGFEDALKLILNTNGLDAQRVGADTLLVIPNTQPKHIQYQDQMIRTFYLSNAKAKEAVNLVKTMLDSKRVYVDEKVNAIVIRDEPDKVQLAERMITSLDRRDPEVELDLEVLEVNRTNSLRYGINFAKQAGAGIIPSGGTGGISTAPTTFTYQQLTSIGPQGYLFTLPASLLLDFFKQQSDAKTLAAPKLRVLNNKPATIVVGDKQPILLSTTNVLPGQAATGAVPTTSTVTSIEFKDTGVKLTVEPTMHLTDELTLKLKVEVTSLGDQVTLQASPEIKQFKFGTRSAETVLMLRDGETVILGGLIQDQERKTRSTLPILGDIPYIGRLFDTVSVDVVSTEVVLTITPHIVRELSLPGIEEQVYWSGTEQHYAAKQLFAPRAVPIATSALAFPHHGETSVPSADPIIPVGESGPSQGQPVPEGARFNTQVSGFALHPAELATAPDREFMIQLLQPIDARAGVASATVSYDPAAVELLHADPADSTVAIRQMPGSLAVTLPTLPATTTRKPVAHLSFRAKALGDTPVTLENQTDGSLPGSGDGKSVSIIHIR